MSRNIELKARVDDLALVRARLVLLDSRGQFKVRQTDTFFNVSRGRLKLREFGDGTGELIYYQRPDQLGTKLSEYERLSCEDPTALRDVLTKALGVRGTVKKQREVTLVDRTRVHLDQVEGLGSFLELEVVLEDDEPISEGERVAEDLMRELDIPQSSLLPGAYIDLIEERAG